MVVCGGKKDQNTLLGVSSDYMSANETEASLFAALESTQMELFS